jgi:gamma-glutamylcyclotransferase (GGCT)/AIG2-like uncharacterized protein YtfP/GNAT superfamily N-acetyltransferase
LRAAEFLIEAGAVPIYYFAYGMLTDPKIMKGADFVGTAVLKNFEYEMFQYANVYPQPGSQVVGVLWSLDRRMLSQLDRTEGYPDLYDRKTVPVYVDGNKVVAELYTMTPETREHLEGTKPRKTYVARIARGYQAAGVPMSQLVNSIRPKQPVAENLEENTNQIRQQLNAWMNQDQQFKNPTERVGFQAKVWPYIEQNINAILSDKGADGKGSYPAAPYAAWLLVQHMDAYPQNQEKFLQQLEQSGLDPTDGKDGVGKLQFLKDRYEVNKWIAANANKPEYFINDKPLPNPTVNVRNPAIFKDAGQVATSRQQALDNAIEAGNKLLVAAVQAPPVKLTQPSYKSNVAENFADGKGPGRPGDSQRHGIPKHATMAELEKASHAGGRKGQLARWQLNMRRGKKANEGLAEDLENYQGIEISIEKKNDEIMVKAQSNGRELGHVLFVEEGEYLMPQDLEVDERYQGQGIARIMYDYVKSKGYRIRRSGQQTDAGAGFWNKHKPGKNIWEAFDKPYPMKWEKGEFGDIDALAKLPDGTPLSIMFNLADMSENDWGVEFYRNNSQLVTREGDAQRVFATVLTAIGQFIKKKKPDTLFFTAVKEEDPTGSRTKLYDRLVQRYATQLGYNLERVEYPEQTGYRFTRNKQYEAR